MERSEVAAQYKWRLDKIFADWDAWESCFAEVESALPGLAKLQGTLDDTLNDSGSGMLATVEQIHNVQRQLEKALVFAGMKSDEDTRDSDNTARKGRVGSLAVKFSESVSWFESEILAMEPEHLKKLRQEEQGLELYAHFFDNIQRERAHTLPAEHEALLAGAGLMSRGAGQVFNAFDNADLALGEITDEDGNTVALTKASYYKFQKSTDRRVRQESYEQFLDTYGAMKNTLAANMDANVKNHVFFAQARNHESTLEASLHPDGVPPEVFHSLIKTVGEKSQLCNYKI